MYIILYIYINYLYIFIYIILRDNGGLAVRLLLFTLEARVRIRASTLDHEAWSLSQGWSEPHPWLQGCEFWYQSSRTSRLKLIDCCSHFSGVIWHCATDRITKFNCISNCISNCINEIYNSDFKLVEAIEILTCLNISQFMTNHSFYQSSSSSSSFIFKTSLSPRSARVRRSSRNEAPPHIPEHCPFSMRTKHLHILLHTFIPSLPPSTHTSNPRHHHISTDRHPIIPTSYAPHAQTLQSTPPHHLIHAQYTQKTVQCKMKSHLKENVTLNLKFNF